MIVPLSTRSRVTTHYPATAAKARRSSSAGLQRRVLDLYAKQRRLTAAAHRAPVSIAAVALLAIAAVISLSAGGVARRAAAGSLRAFARLAAGAADAVDGGDRSLDMPTVDRGADEGEAEGGTDDSSVDNTPAGDASAAWSQRGGGAPKNDPLADVVDAAPAPTPAAAPVPATPPPLARLNYVTPRSVPPGHVSLKAPLQTPAECAEWRRMARNTSRVHPYRKHFTSLDVIDWFAYIAVFDEPFHAAAAARHRRPRYLDVAANHARRWSATWFFDRCMGWDGVCAEANPKYFPELAAERHCHVIPTCVSDSARKVKFSMTDAYGGVVREGTQRYGVDGSHHANDVKYKNQFKGIRELTCTTLKKEMSRLEMSHFDFMSLDVEGHELPILQGVDWQTTRINVIVTENRTPSVRALLEGVGYTLYRDVLKDFIYIRNDSGLVLREEDIKLVRRMDRKTYEFARAQ